MNIREAKRSDMSSVLKLIKELAKFENDPEAVEVTVDELIDNGFKINPSFRIYLAEMDHKIVGIALFYERYSTWKGRSIHLEDLIVEEKYRGKGIGNALYAEVLKYAHKNGFKRVVWEVLDWNTTAIDFYKSTGARVLEEWRVVHMDQKSLSQYVQNIKDNS